MSLKNFLLIHYNKKKFDIDVGDYLESLYCNIQLPALMWMIDQIRKFYSDGTIHILTNVKDFKLDNCKIHYKNIPSNHTAKFHIYSLISEPIMYIDCDIKINRMFNLDELNSEHAFKLYQKANKINFNLLNASLPTKETSLYNAGVVWVTKPSVEITNELIDINEKYFSDIGKIKASGHWPYNDEYALAIYINRRNMGFEKSLVGVPYLLDAQKSQSIHYTGIDGKRHLKNIIFNDRQAKFI